MIGYEFPSIISETWLNNSDDSVELEGYDFIHSHRHGSVGGGVGLFLDSNLDFKLREDLNDLNIELAESLFVEILNPKGKGIVIGTIYRSPKQNVNGFIQKFNSLMAKIAKENKICYLMGDFNLNLMNYILINLLVSFWISFILICSFP